MKNLYYLFILSFLIISCEEEVPPITYTLTTKVTPAGAGSVTPSSGTYDEGESVTIAATPSANYNFKQWTGTGSGTANPLTFKIISNTIITAEFELIDADGDGVADALDKCSDSPVGSTVNAEGCATSQLDTDKDGVTDDIDKCFETPDGETVDENGCSDSQVDTDGDGVTDDKDLCAETPDGETVDENGCSDSQKDTDGDGVTDDKDLCVTPDGETVDENGCFGFQNDTDSDEETLNEKFIFNYNLHVSLPDEWISEFYTIIGNLENLIPATPRSYQDNMSIYSWVNNVDKPFKNYIGNSIGACICGIYDTERYMVLEIPDEELKYNHLHRFSVIAHEYFHVYQMSLSESFFDGHIKVKWLSEGTAASFESIYIRQFYGENYFEAQNGVDISVINNPSIFENFYLSSDKDPNYSSSVFMALALTKELQKNGKTEEEAFRLIYKDFWELNPLAGNWKTKFEELFSLTVDQFYDKLGDYTNDINSVTPSENLKIENIFN